ncbi:hypothetical protein [Microbacterium sp. H1-D42]|uniref:hypothetical protein n=1 Tax=Microbacterium sp. H1-D42 TaxID=2925844 RepID=UPI001F53A7A7|nr:hypothetical protein [Microbacterium sp. H1-D42]UNK69388.1 hypothetical protein MNR00_09310 [Microbacterium sp. H1-D42]
MTDSLDDLLDRAAPMIADRGSARDAALAQMVSDARDTARPVNRPRRQVAVLSGLAALALGGFA